MKTLNKVMIIVFSFFQGMFLTGIILLAVFNFKVIPVIQKKNGQIKQLEEMIIDSRTQNRHHKEDWNNKTFQIKNI